MKAKVKELGLFKPFEITLTFETLKEAQTFYHVFNGITHSALEALGLNGDPIKEVMEEACSVELYDSKFNSLYNETIRKQIK